MSEDPFVTHRSLLFTVAYEMLGSAADAEDVIQESWLRWDGVDKSEVRDPRAYLVRIVTNQSLSRLRSLARRREDYFGEWLPEPLLTTPDVAEDVELADSISMAMLTVLETLSPTERAVFVLREVFDLPYDEIAEAVGKSAPAVRQIAHRARGHVSARRPRSAVSRTEQQQVVALFIDAIRGGDLQPFLDALAPDVVFISDGGGQRVAVPVPVEGSERVGRLIGRFGLFIRRQDRVELTVVEVNGSLGIRLDVDGVLEAVMTPVVEDGRITKVYAMRNPQKLGRLDEAIQLAR